MYEQLKPRDQKVDIAKLIASLLVVQGHLLSAIGETSIAINICHMPTFYFISGMLAFRSSKKYTIAEFIKRKALTLMIPYFLWSAVSILFNGVLLDLEGRSHEVYNEVVDIFLYARSVWFLVQIFFAFVIFAICLELGKRGKTFYAANAAVYIALLFILPDQLFTFYKFKWLYPFFILGYAFSDFKDKIVPLWRKVPGFSFATGFLACLFPLLTYCFVNDEIYPQYMLCSYENVTCVLQGVGCYLISVLGIIFIFTLATILTKTKFVNCWNGYL